MKKNSEDNDSAKLARAELPKGVDHIVIEIAEYMPNAVISRTIIKKITGNVTAMSFSEGEELSEKSLPFDTYIQIIDGAADITIDGQSMHLNRGSGVIIPAHSLHRFNATQRFKMVSTIIKSGYE